MVQVHPLMERCSYGSIVIPCSPANNNKAATLHMVLKREILWHFYTL